VATVKKGVYSERRTDSDGHAEEDGGSPPDQGGDVGDGRDASPHGMAEGSASEECGEDKAATEACKGKGANSLRTRALSGL
jgi:hypothetical protein